MEITKMKNIEDTEARNHLKLLNSHILLRNYRVVKEEAVTKPFVINTKTLILVEIQNPKNKVTIYFQQGLTPEFFNCMDQSQEDIILCYSNPDKYYVQKILF